MGQIELQSYPQGGLPPYSRQTQKMFLKNVFLVEKSVWSAWNHCFGS